LASSGKEVIQMVKLIAIALVVLVLGVGIGYGVKARMDSGVGCQAATDYFREFDSMLAGDNGFNKLGALLSTGSKAPDQTETDFLTQRNTVLANQLFAAFHQMQDQCN